MARPIDARRELFAQSKERTKRRRLAWLIIVGGGLALLLIGAVGLLRLEQIRVTEVVVVGNQSIPAETLKELVMKELSGTRFLMIPRNVSLLIDRQKLGEVILDTYPTVSRVALELEGLTKLQVTVSERQPKVLWCVSGEAASSENCWYTDATGVLFARAQNFSDTLTLKISGLITPSTAVLGTRVLPKEEFADLIQTADTLPKVIATAGIFPSRPKRLLLDGHGDVQMVIAGRETTASSTASGDWYVTFNRKQSEADLIASLATILSAPEFVADRAGRSLEYIDLRFGKKVFYKFKQ